MTSKTDPTKAKRKLYNLTLHKQRNLAILYQDSDLWEVEESPRLVPVRNPQDWAEMKSMVRRAIEGIPKGSNVLIGGMTQIANLIAELGMFQLWYIVLDDDDGKKARAVPVSFDRHREWTRVQRFSIEEES